MKKPLALRLSKPSELSEPLRAALTARQAEHSTRAESSTGTGSFSGRDHVLLLHGTVDSPGAWQSLAEALYDAGFIVHVPAFGHRGTAPLATSVHEVADIAAHILERSTTDASERLNIVGHSQGGAIAFDLLSDPRLAGRIDTVVSISGTVHGSSWPRQLRWIFMGRRWIARILAGQAMVDQMYRYGRDLGAVVGKPRPRRWVNLLSHGDGIVGAESVARPEDFGDEEMGATSNADCPGTEVTTLWIEDLIGRPVVHWQQQGDPDVVKPW